MEKLIPIINQLQDVFTSVGSSTLQLPQLVVVGSQSAGKSSVLENIVGRDFLPRGNNIVTRRPLILQLINTSDSKSSLLPNDEKKDGSDSKNASEGAEWGEFLHKGPEKFTDFSEIRREIELETERLLGSNKAISNQPINLKIYSPNVLNLTLVDLPGITKVPVGDQPDDIEQQIRNLVLQFISNPNSIIVAVSPANADIANSEALKIAKEVDPDGSRTLGVITKIDLMDKGTDALNLLVGNIIPLKHGFVGVVNRSQADINSNLAISDQHKAERDFFANHPAYRSISHALGTPFLAKRLNQILIHHIQQCLPEIRNRICTTLRETRQELESYGTDILSNGKHLGPMLLHLLGKFGTSYCDALDGKSPDVSTNELYGGARISYVFHDMFAEEIKRIEPFDVLSDTDIRTAIRNATGSRPSLFIPEVSFEVLVKRQIERLQAPALNCVDMVFEELKRVATQCEQLVPELARFPVLREKILHTVKELLKRRVRPTKKMIIDLFNIELSYINTNHPDFIGGSRAVSSLVQRGGPAGGRRGPPQNNNINMNNNNNTNNLMPGHPSQQHQQRLQQQQQQQHPNNPQNNSSPSTPQAPSSSAPVTPGQANTQHLDEKGNDHDTQFYQATSRPNQDISSSSGGVGGFAAAYSSRMKEMNLRNRRPTDRERIETEIIKSLIESYFHLVRKNITDSVPKAIMFFLVNNSKANVPQELVHTLYKDSLFEDLLCEADDISSKRNSCREMIEISQRALDIVNQVRDLNSTVSSDPYFSTRANLANNSSFSSGGFHDGALGGY